MAQRYDVAIVGLGAAGSAAAYHLARRGLRVFGCDRWKPPHGQGSSAGHSRVFRTAYFEGEAYVPLAQRAENLWRGLGRADEGPAAAGQDRLAAAGVLEHFGALTLGPPGSDEVAGTLLSAERNDIDHERLTAEAIQARWPSLRVPRGWFGVVEAGAGVLDADACIQRHLAGATAAGATLSLDDPAVSWEAGHRCDLKTARSRVTATTLVMAAGPWLPDLVPTLPTNVWIERQVHVWLEPRLPDAAELPVLLWSTPDAHLFYALPDRGRGIKAARHHGGAHTRAEALDRDVHDSDLEPVRRWLGLAAPGLAGAVREAMACMYTNTRDEDFLIDWLPGGGRALIVSPCSGHGFKFASAVGELVADMVAGTPPSVDPAPFSFARFGA